MRFVTSDVSVGGSTSKCGSIWKGKEMMGREELSVRCGSEDRGTRREALLPQPTLPRGRPDGISGVLREPAGEYWDEKQLGALGVGNTADQAPSKESVSHHLSSKPPSS